MGYPNPSYLGRAGVPPFVPNVGFKSPFPTVLGLFGTVGTAPPQPTPPSAEVPGGGNDRRRRKVIRLSDLNERERIEALAQLKVRPFTPIEQAAENVALAKGPEETEDEEDDLMRLVILRLLH